MYFHVTWTFKQPKQILKNGLIELFYITLGNIPSSNICQKQCQNNLTYIFWQPRMTKNMISSVYKIHTDNPNVTWNGSQRLTLSLFYVDSKFIDTRWSFWSRLLEHDDYNKESTIYVETAIMRTNRWLLKRLFNKSLFRTKTSYNLFVQGFMAFVAVGF